MQYACGYKGLHSGHFNLLPNVPVRLIMLRWVRSEDFKLITKFYSETNEHILHVKESCKCSAQGNLSMEHSQGPSFTHNSWLNPSLETEF